MKTSEEVLHVGGMTLPVRLKHFWMWANSDLVSNTARGIFAEFLVASALDIADGTRIELDAKDLVTRTGIALEVKSAAYIQAWQQQSVSRVVFDVAPKRGWDGSKQGYLGDAKRRCDVYILFTCREKSGNPRPTGCLSVEILSSQHPNIG